MFQKKRLPKINKQNIASDKILQKQLQQYQSIRYSNGDTLKPADPIKKYYYTQTDHKFIEDIERIANSGQTISNILGNVAQINKLKNLDDKQCEQIHYEGNLHHKASKLTQQSAEVYQRTPVGRRCQCGCKHTFGQNYSLCQSINEIEVLGSGPILFTLFSKATVVNLFIVAFSLGLFCTIMNMRGTVVEGPLCQDLRCKTAGNTSILNMGFYKKGFSQQNIISIIVCIVWLLICRFIKNIGKQIDISLDKNLLSASDYAIKISNLPSGKYSQEQLIEHIKNIWQKQKPGNNLGLKSLQVIYRMNFARKIIEQIRKNSKQIMYIIQKDEEKFKIKKSDLQEYKQTKQNIISSYQLLKDLRKKFINDVQFRRKISSETCIVQFVSNSEMLQFLQIFGKQKVGFLKKLQSKFKMLFCPKANNIIFHGKILQIERAPNPSDLIWLNCQKPSSTPRLAIIYTITFFLILVSFGLLLGVNYLSFWIKNKRQPDTLTQILEMATSILLQVINRLMWQILHWLLAIQYSHSLTQSIVSLMNKALFANTVNSIILPLIVFLLIKDDFSPESGLLGFIIDYHISILTVNLILRALNPIYLIKRIILKIRWLRNIFLRFKRSSYGDEDDQIFKKDILKVYQGDYFNIAQAYIFIITNIFHAFFYCNLSPPLLIFAFLQNLLYFWINKYKFLRVFKIPELTQILVFDSAIVLISLSPIIYGVGTIVTQYFLNIHNSAYEIDYMWGFIVIGIGMINFLNPCNIFNKPFQLISQYMFKNNEVKLDQDSSSNFNRRLSDINRRLSDININNSGIAIRVQNYYQNSNSLKLFGFEQVIRSSDQNKYQLQLKYFCQRLLIQNNIQSDKSQYEDKIVQQT